MRQRAKAAARARLFTGAKIKGLRALALSEIETMKIWKDGEFTPFANRIMYAACWVLGIAGFYFGSM